MRDLGLVLLGFFGSLLLMSFIIIDYNKQNKELRKECVARGIAEWEVNPETGFTTFTWKK